MQSTGCSPIVRPYTFRISRQQKRPKTLADPYLIKYAARLSSLL
jgi:hypothetical protein